MESDWSGLISAMKDRGWQFGPGLSDSEVQRAEDKFELKFPPDLRAFLQTGLPVGDRFPDWRSEAEDEEKLRDSLGWPLHGILFDVEHNTFWEYEWGRRPANSADALEVARAQFKAFPKLVPIYSHRYIPERPVESGSPVFSVYQTDIIWYGFDLEDYLRHEFKIEPLAPWPEVVKPIEFWDPLRFDELRWAEDQSNI